MLRVLRSSQRIKRKGLISGLALALVLAGGAATVVTSTPAFAQSVNPSRNFSRAATPVQDVLAKADSDAAAAAIVAQIEAAQPDQRAPLHRQFDAALGVNQKVESMVQAIDKQDDRFVAGKFILDIGVKIHDPAMQKRGLKLMLESGLAPEENLGIYNYFVSTLSYDSREYADAREYMRKAIDLGYTSGDNVGVVYLMSYFNANMEQEGLDATISLIDTNAAAKQILTEGPLRQALKVAYESGLFYEMGRLLLLLNDWYPSTESAQYLAALPMQISSTNIAADAPRLVSAVDDPRAWNMAANAIIVQQRLTEREALEAMRLLMRLDALRSAAEYRDMLTGIGPQSNPTEAEAVLNAGLKAGLLNGSDEVVVETQGQIAGARGEDRAYIEDAKVLADARKGPAPNIARTVGNTAFSLGEYALAEEMFQLAIGFGEAEPDQLRLRLGIAQLMQGKSEEAKATLATVSGKFSPVARLWLAYGEKRSAG